MVPQEPNPPPPPQGGGQFVPPPRQKPASMATYKRQLRTAIRKNAGEVEINFLNITAMMDMMTIILVFLLKSMATSTSPPQSADLMIPKSIVSSEAAQEGLTVLVSKTWITVDDHQVVPVPPDATHGVEGRYKKNGNPNELTIQDLASSLKAWRDKDVAMRAAMGKDTNSSEAIIIGDTDMPYRLLTEVLYTLGQGQFAKYHLMVLQAQKG